jgi:hypothetical protein
MNLFVEWVGDNWRGIGLLLAAMALPACSITTQVPMSPTATSPTVSRGGYVGFRRFFAIVAKGPKGDYIKGRIEHIEGIPVSSAGSSTEDDAIETALTEDNCKEWGYTDFNGAS